MELQKLPIGEQDFETLRQENRLYIDKTELICQMIQDGTYYFLSRPRRFGKSLLLSTIEAYFLGKRELFNGISFSTTTRRPDDWIIERGDGSQKVDRKSGPEKWTGTKLNERQEAIVEWISNHPNTTYDEMSERFGVSRQTIYKDTKKLQALGVIIREGEDFGGIWKRVSQ